MEAIYFYHTDGRFLGSAVIGAAADRMEDQLTAKYGKEQIIRKEGLSHETR